MLQLLALYFSELSFNDGVFVVVIGYFLHSVFSYFQLLLLSCSSLKHTRTATETLSKLCAMLLVCYSVYLCFVCHSGDVIATCLPLEALAKSNYAQYKFTE